MKVVKSILLSLFVAASVNAATLYLKENVKTKDIDVLAGVPVEKLADKVIVTGVLKDKELYATKNLSLKIADVKNLDAVKKDGDKVKVTFTASADVLAEDYYDAWELKEELFLEKCSQCHAAPEIGSHTMLEWEGLYTSMKGFAQPTDAEEVVILRYLKTFAKDGIIKEE